MTQSTPIHDSTGLRPAPPSGAPTLISTGAGAGRSGSTRPESALSPSSVVLNRTGAVDDDPANRSTERRSHAGLSPWVSSAW